MTNKIIICSIFLLNFVCGFCRDESIDKAELLFRQGKINESLENYFLGMAYLKVSDFQNSRENFEKSFELVKKNKGFDSFWYRSKIQYYLTELPDKMKEKDNSEVRSNKQDIRKQKTQKTLPKGTSGGVSLNKAEDKEHKAEGLNISNDDILNGLKERHAIKPDKSEISPEDILLFNAILEAEKRGAVDYLKRKFYSLSGYILRKDEPGGKIKLFLTFKGYQTY